MKKGSYIFVFLLGIAGVSFLSFILLGVEMTIQSYLKSGIFSVVGGILGSAGCFVVYTAVKDYFEEDKTPKLLEVKPLNIDKFYGKGNGYLVTIVFHGVNLAHIDFLWMCTPKGDKYTCLVYAKGIHFHKRKMETRLGTDDIFESLLARKDELKDHLVIRAEDNLTKEYYTTSRVKLEAENLFCLVHSNPDELVYLGETKWIFK